MSIPASDNKDHPAMNHCRWRSILSWLALTVVGGASPAALADVPNASFEQGSGTAPDAWTWTNPSPALKTEWTRGEAHTGQRAMRVRVPGELNHRPAMLSYCPAAKK
ncbi:MAG: hypothetical protein HUU20_02325 [Pirellulales bacterium]|nr:hypothetical protein [Pirellulales bacterium]